MELDSKISLLNSILEIGHYDKTIKEFEVDYRASINNELESQMKSFKISDDIINLYQYSNGIDMKWNNDNEKGVSGQMRMLNIENVLQDWKNEIYYESDIEENDLLEYYKPIDFVTPEVSSGILITPEFTSDSIYCHINGNTDLFDLDLDFEGYIDMAVESKIYNLWTIVLLQIQKQEEGVETKSFKENMPKIFSDFNWDKFVKKYESLRLSKREE